MENRVEIFKALGDTNRMRIVCMLKERDLCVCEINAILNVSMSTISSHLKILRNARLVTSKKDGRWIIYSLSSADAEIMNIINMSVSYMASEEQIIADRNSLKTISPENCTTA